MEQKRILIFVACMALAAFAVNLFFNYQHQEKLKAWEQQQTAKNSLKIKQLESEIEKRTAKPEALPLMDIYGDAQATELLANGVSDDNFLITMPWDGSPPQTLFARKHGSQDKAQEYVLEFVPKSTDEPVIYRQGAPSQLKVVDLPDLGHYELQLVTLKPLKISVVDLSDGHLSIPLQKLAKLRKPLDPEPTALTNGILLYKSGSKYVPAALYEVKNNSPKYFDELPNLASLLTVQPTRTDVSKEQVQTSEKFYVLENDYQQLVFSNVGGALVEINLPFHKESDKESVVKEIEYDRDMVKNHPYNARFPSHPYYKPGSQPQGPFSEHIEGNLGGYYPLIRRDLIVDYKGKSTKVPPRFYALNIVSEFPEVAETIYTVKEFTSTKIVFQSVLPHRTVTKTFSLEPDVQGAPYCVNLTIDIEGDAKGLWLTSGVPEVEIISGSPAPALKYRITRNNKPEVETIDLPKDALTNTSIFPDWIVDSNGFLGVILNPVSPTDAGFRAQFVPGTVVPSRLVEIEKEYQKYKAAELPGYQLMMPLKSSGGTQAFHVFAGPFSDDVLKAVDNFYSDPTTGYNPDFIASQTYHGWFSFVSEPFAKFLFVLMKFFYSLTHSWAFSIILLTIALRIMLYPLNAWSMKSMINMQKIAPEVTAIQEKYKKDPKRAQLEVVNLYREKGVNPLTGCLPLLIQMPFLIGMFDLLKSTFELRGASFIPGWIDNLTAPDVLFT